jgi:hypothetical protein
MLVESFQTMVRKKLVTIVCRKSPAFADIPVFGEAQTGE